jgi:hypothetical protein
MFLEGRVLIAAGRQDRGKDIEPEPAAASILPKIKLHLLAGDKLRHLGIEKRALVQAQSVCLDEIADMVPQALFIGRECSVSLLQIVVNGRHLELFEVIGSINLEDLLPVGVEGLVPIKVALTVGAELLFFHGKVFSHRLGVKLQSLADRRLGVPLPLELLHLSKHRLVDHHVSCKVFPNLTGVTRKREFHLPRPWEIYLP